jgi:hypothetical protein
MGNVPNCRPSVWESGDLYQDFASSPGISHADNVVSTFCYVISRQLLQMVALDFHLIKRALKECDESHTKCGLSSCGMSRKSVLEMELSMYQFTCRSHYIAPMNANIKESPLFT